MPTYSITCDICGESYEYEDEDHTGRDWIDAEALPDGYFVDGMWICDKCGSCPECGRSLEKEDGNRRAKRVNGEFKPAQMCTACEEEDGKMVKVEFSRRHLRMLANLAELELISPEENEGFPKKDLKEIIEALEGEF